MEHWQYIFVQLVVLTECIVPTWVWMYLVWRPCSSSPSPSTSALYLGLRTTMISTDFWNTAPHSQLTLINTLSDKCRYRHLDATIRYVFSLDCICLHRAPLCTRSHKWHYSVKSFWLLRRTSFKKPSIHLLMSILLRGLSKMSICQTKQECCAYYSRWKKQTIRGRWEM